MTWAQASFQLAKSIGDPLGRGIRAGIDQLLPILERSRTQRKAVVVIELEPVCRPNDTASCINITQP
jgi:hypothetical protein